MHDASEVILKRTLKTTSSWFRIRRENVPNLEAPARPAPPASYSYVLMDEYTLDPYLYGRIQRFVQVDVDGGETLHLAQVRLYQSSAAATHTGLRHIDLKAPLMHQHPRNRERVALEYVQVAHLVSCIAVVPFPCIAIDPAAAAAAARRSGVISPVVIPESEEEKAKIRMYVLPIEI
jgi:hypothetical protein